MNVRAGVVAAALSLVSLVAVCTTGQDGDAVVFEGARLITGDGSAAIDNGAFVVQGGRIEQIGTSSALEKPAGATTIDLRGKTVMPMIVNVHGHVGYMKGATTGSEHYSRENVLDHLGRFVYYGVGAIQSLGTGRGGVEMAIRDEQRAGRFERPRAGNANSREIAAVYRAGVAIDRAALRASGIGVGEP